MTDLTLTRSVLRDALGRSLEIVPDVVDGLDREGLRWRPDDEANPIGWLVWHLARQMDVQVADLAGLDEVWTSQGWVERFDLPYPGDALGYGMSADDVGAFDVADPQLLVDYHAAAVEAAGVVIGGLGQDDMERVVDDSWDPPVTVAARLVSVIDDAAQHLGQASYVRGLLDRR